MKIQAGHIGCLRKKSLEIFGKRPIEAKYEHLFVGILGDVAGPRDEYYCLSGSSDAVYETMALAERVRVSLLA